MPTICRHIPTNDVTVRQEFHTNTNAELVFPIAGLVICKYTQKEQNVMGTSNSGTGSKSRLMILPIFFSV